MLAVYSIILAVWAALTCHEEGDTAEARHSWFFANKPFIAHPGDSCRETL